MDNTLHGKKMANARIYAYSPAAFIAYQQEPDRLEQIRGAAVDREHQPRVERCLGALVAHRADCGFYPGNVPGRSWMNLAGLHARNAARAVDRFPPVQFASRWVQEWR